MPKLYSSHDVVAVLTRHGFRFVSQRGSHMKFRSSRRIVIVPSNRREIPLGTFKSILRQAHLDEKDFKGV